MFTRCLSCHRPFSENESLERLRSGRRLAYDPERGRIWTLCEACRAWTLAPIEARWEALEELEKVTRDSGRLLASTDHVGLIEVEDLEIVRVGAANLPEEAWWRYGSELLRRRRRRNVNQALEVAGMVGLALATGGAAVVFADGGIGPLSEFQRWRRYGRTAWRGEARCSRCERPLAKLRFSASKHLRVDGVTSDGIALVLPCRRCRVRRVARPDAVHRIDGVAGEHVLRRVMAHRNFGGGKEKQIRRATDLIREAGSPQAFVRRLGPGETELREVGNVKKRLPSSLALEIAVNDDAERRLMRMELDALEARWREEEEIAAIIDGELTPLPEGARLFSGAGGRA